ncbi:MAG: DUF2304 domain-containing protein [Thermoanaerobaculia bacterium]
MTPFQLLAISGLAVVAILTIRAVALKKISRAAGVFWLALWISGAIAIGWPAITVQVASRLGIARGADLVSYLSILAMLIGFFWINLRIRRMESQITAVVRELALRAPEKSGSNGAE